MTKSRGINKPHWRWHEADVMLVQLHYADSLTADLAAAIGCTKEQVYHKARLLGLAKAAQTVAEIARERAADPNHPMHRSGFPKGHVPANKGLRRPGWAVGRMAETQFKKGQLPYTWKPIGALRVDSDGYLARKVTDTGYPPRDWVTVHRLIWTEAHGRVPDGHAVCFKPGLRTTVEEEITLDSIELLSRAQLMERNTIHRMPPRLAEVSRLRGTLKRAINRRSKEQA